MYQYKSKIAYQAMVTVGHTLTGITFDAADTTAYGRNCIQPAHNEKQSQLFLKVEEDDEQT